jgi:CheY-like chemotaxis protein/c-di-GMP-binding flagellar brake protein YcgR
MIARSPAPRILITDSEPTNCRVFEAKLTRHHAYRVVSVTSGSSALQCAIENTFDLLLWDMRLLDSSSHLPRLRALCPDAALLLMTTDDRPQLDPDYALLDVSDILIKPFNLETMMEKIQSALTRPRVTGSYARLDLVRVGQQMTLELESGVCATRVLEYRQDSILVVGPPRIEAPEGVAPGQRVEALIKGMDALYRFRSRILRLHTHPVPCWELQKPKMIQREQRRRYPRLTLRLPVSFAGAPVRKTARPASSSSAGRRRKKEGKEPSVVNYTENISLGGFALISGQSLPVGTEVDFAFHPADAVPFAGKGRIVRVEPLEDALPAPETRFHLALEFTALDTTARRALDSLLHPTDSLSRLASAGENRDVK